MSFQNMFLNSFRRFSVLISVPLLLVNRDPMRLLFEKDLTPHPQYCATYKWLQASPDRGGFGTDALIHLGMHG